MVGHYFAIELEPGGVFRTRGNHLSGKRILWNYLRETCVALTSPAESRSAPNKSLERTREG